MLRAFTLYRVEDAKTTHSLESKAGCKKTERKTGSLRDRGAGEGDGDSSRWM
jgi:hypothetical protein